MRILTLLFLFLTNPLFASFQMNERMQQSYTHIINLEFEAANKLLQIEQLENPDNAILVLHQNYIDFLTIIIGEEAEFFSTAKELKSGMTLGGGCEIALHARSTSAYHCKK